MKPDHIVPVDRYEARCDACNWRSGELDSLEQADAAVRDHGRYQGCWEAMVDAYDADGHELLVIR